jgi:hypothetical protein
MIYKEQNRIKKLKRRIGFLIVILTSLIYWDIIKYQDYQFTVEENEILTYELMQIECERDSLIRVLNKQTQKHEQVEPIIKKTTKNKSTQLIDTLKKDSTLPKIIEYTPEGGSEMLDEPLSDTLKR